MSRAVYLLQGDEFLAEEALERLRAEEGTDPLAEVSLDAGVDPAELLTVLGTASLLGGRRLVVVRDAHGLKKNQATALTSYLESPSPSSVLALVATGRTAVDSIVRKTGEVIVLDAPRGKRLAGWIRARARELDMRLDDRAAWGLMDAVGGDLRALSSALAQLSAALGPGARVGAEEVKRLFPRLADQRIYAFTDAVGDRRLDVAMANLRRLLEQGEEPLVLFGALTGHIRRMLRVQEVADRGARAVGDAVRLPGWRAERLIKQVRGYRRDELVAAMGILAETDVELKGGDLPPGGALERAVIQIVGAYAPAGR
ncbi:MAG: DNA polymerase III subunit delta [Actinobacteria bacterium]|nr:DNA polymerase III subunit delta [Actinomycetota bacterium]